MFVFSMAEPSPVLLDAAGLQAVALPGMARHSFLSAWGGGGGEGQALTM